MPYVTCATCKLTAFTAAYRWLPDHCARCGSELPRPRSAGARAQNPGRTSRPKPRTGTALQHTRPFG